MKLFSVGGRSRARPDQIGSLRGAESAGACVTRPSRSLTRHFPSIVNAIQPNRIKNEMAVIRAAIAKWFAIHKIAGRIFDQLGRESVQRVRIRAVPASVPRQSDGDDYEPAPGF